MAESVREFVRGVERRLTTRSTVFVLSVEEFWEDGLRLILADGTNFSPVSLELADLVVDEDVQ